MPVPGIYILAITPPPPLGNLSKFEKEKNRVEFRGKNRGEKAKKEERKNGYRGKIEGKSVSDKQPGFLLLFDWSFSLSVPTLQKKWGDLSIYIHI